MTSTSLRVLFGVLLLGGLASVGCGSTQSASGQSTDVQEFRATSCQPAAYPQHAIQQIMALREQGESLAEVAKVVGGTRADVRAAERLQKARRRGHGGDLASLGGAGCARFAIVTVGRANLR